MISEILLLHHTHTDVGYTHPQPVFWEIHRRMIDQAIDLCEQTADAPEASRVRWTCEVTWPVLYWLKRASSRQIDRFRALAKAGQLAVGALPLHLSPCANTPAISHGLRALRLLREELGVAAKVAVSHDVNGLPWPLTGLLLDAGVEALFMGINIHSGGYPCQRPRWFHWVAPDGRDLPAYNGMHYNTFGRESRHSEGSTAIMQQSLDAYLAKLIDAGYDRGSVTLTVTHPTLCDNYPPDPAMAQMVRRWNDEGRSPVIRFATPEMVLARFQQDLTAVVPSLSGDWSDFWNFGCASSPTETRINRNTAGRLHAAGMLRTAIGSCEASTELSLDAWRNLILFDEHTWGADRTVQTVQTDLIDQLWTLDAAHAWQANALTGLLLRDSFNVLAANPTNASGPHGLLCFNPSPVYREGFVRVPVSWCDGTWRMCSSNSARIELDRTLWDDGNSIIVGPLALEPHGMITVPAAALVAASPRADLLAGTGFIESAHHRLRFDPETGNVTSLIDKRLDREFVDADAAWPLFGYVHEMPDPAHHDIVTGELGRDAYFLSDWDRLHDDQDCWQYDWKALRRGPGKLLDCRVETAPDGITLVTVREAPGVRHDGGATIPPGSGAGESARLDCGFMAHMPGALIQRIKLCALRPVVEFTATFNKENTRHAEAIYFAFPLDLAGWSAHYDAAGVPTRWIDEQLPGTCNNWVTTGAWVSVHNADAGVTLATPDAPLVQIGDFGFGRPQGFARDRIKPLLLGWATNNYWMTNFRASHPGHMRFHYELRTHGAFDPVVSTHAGQEAACPLEIHPVMAQDFPPARSFLKVSPSAVIPLAFAPCDDGSGSLQLTLQNLTTETVTATIELPGPHGPVYQSNALGERIRHLADTSPITVALPPRGTCLLRIDPS